MKRHRGLTESVLYQCPHCPYSTDEAATLIGHQRNHANEKPYKCWVCNEVFANSGDFCSHQSVHMRPFACPTSGKASSASGSLRARRQAGAGSSVSTPPAHPPFLSHCTRGMVGGVTAAGQVMSSLGGKSPAATPSVTPSASLTSEHGETLSFETWPGVKMEFDGEEPSTTLPIVKREHGGIASSEMWPAVEVECGGEDSSFKCSVCDEVFVNSRDLCFHQSVHVKQARRGKAFTPSPGDVSPDERNHAGERPYCCNVCGEDFTQSHHLLNHQRIHTSKKPYACTVCGKTFAHSAVFLAHKRVHTGQKPYRCATCGKAFKQSGTLFNHEKTHAEEKPYGCAACGKRFAQSKGLVRHARTHTGERPHRCTTCGKSFAQSDTLRIHKRTHTGERPYACDVCGSSFTHVGTLHVHKRTHAGGRPFACPTRGKASSGSGSLRAQQQARAGSSASTPPAHPPLLRRCAGGRARLHEGVTAAGQVVASLGGEGPATTPSASLSSEHGETLSFETWPGVKMECDSEYPSTTLLIMKQERGGIASSEMCPGVKVESEGEDSSFKCSVCDEDFVNSRELCFHQSVHMKQAQRGKALAPPPGDVSPDERNHAGERPYCCNVCGEDFTQSDHLLNHQRIHTSKKPYACAVCGKTFAHSAVFVAHKRVHTGKKPYRCATCGKAFKQSGTLFNHEKTHAEEKPYGCTVCGKRFAQSKGLVIHTRTHTGEKPYKCSTCGKSFAQSGTLGIHKRTHTGEKPYACDMCGSSFTHLGTLHVHKRTHAGGKASSGSGSLRARRQTHADSSVLTPPARPPLLRRCTRRSAGLHEGVTAAGQVVASLGGEGPAATPSATPLATPSASLTSEHGETLSFETWPGVKVECDGEDPSSSLPIVKQEHGGIASSKTWTGVKVECGGEDFSVPLSIVKQEREESPGCEMQLGLMWHTGGRVSVLGTDVEVYVGRVKEEAPSKHVE
ncbi:uncharacterized protein LOC144948293 [Lampetra fluviatilis]